MATASFNLADLFELVVDTVGDRTAVVAGDTRQTYAELEARSNRLAHDLLEAGVQPGEFVGIYSWNRAEWVEAMVAAYKIRAVPININYRYVVAELDYLFDNAGFAALVVERSFVGKVAAVRDRSPGLRRILVLADGAPSDAEHTLADEVDYEKALATAAPDRDFAPRSGDDLYGLYTGGTTGMPKCVLWRVEDIFFAAMFGGNPMGEPLAAPTDVIAQAANPPRVSVFCPPLMHGAAQWTFWMTVFSGSTAVFWTGHRFDPAGIWDLVDRERALTLMTVGDAMARPLIETLAAHPGRWDVSSLAAFSSGGAPLSAPVRGQIRAALPGVIIIDGFGSSEMGAAGRSTGDDSGADGRDTRAHFAVSDTTAVLDENLAPVAAGSGIVGRLARTGAIPLRYHGDPEKTAATFITDRDGRRWAIPGDWATIEADGTIVVLGRGNACINTGGEKVYPEEVETALKAHADVFDTAVVGVPDERFGERVVALVAPRAGQTVDVPGLISHCREVLAGYKVPKQVYIVDEVPRTATGKTDLRAAKSRAAALASA